MKVPVSFLCNTNIVENESTRYIVHLQKRCNIHTEQTQYKHRMDVEGMQNRGRIDIVHTEQMLHAGRMDVKCIRNRH